MKRIIIISLLLMSSLLSLDIAIAETPAPIRERIEWCNVWITNADQDDLPRVLFVGDSITQGYFGPTEKLIADKANCARITSSRSVCDPIYFDELSLILKQYDFEVIHVNNGLHGWGYTEEQYRAGLEKLLIMLITSAPDTKLIWAASTPVKAHSGMSANAHRVALRNRIATELVATKGIPVNDLYSLVEDHDEYFRDDGVHFNEDGRNAQAEQVAGVVLKVMGE